MFKFVVMRQAWVKEGQTKGWFQNGRQSHGRGADVGRSRADDVVLGQMAESWSWSRHGSKPGGRRQRRGSKTEGEGTGTRQRLEQMLTQGLGQRLRKLGS